MARTWGEGGWQVGGGRVVEGGGMYKHIIESIPGIGDWLPQSADREG